MKLDINENNLILDIPKKYYLDIKLTYPVLSEIGNAKYDPKNKKLKIFLVINQSKLSEFMKEKEPEPPKIEELPQIKQEENSNIISEGEEIPEIKQEIEKNEMKFENYEAESEIQDSLLEFKEKNCLLKMAQKNPKKEENEKEEKKLIEEIIETDKNIVKTEKNIEKVENQIKIPKILDFKTQENSQKYFIIINIPNYSKENCYVRNISNEVI